MPATTAPARLQEVAVCAPLAERVEFLLWVPPSGSLTREHEVIPDANADLLLELSDGHCRAVLHGPLTRPRRVPTQAGHGYLAVHFHPGALPRLVDATAAELVNEAVELRTLGGVSLDALGARLLAAGTLAPMCEVLEPLLRRLCAPRGDTFDRVLHYLRTHPGPPRPGVLAKALHLSPRTLQRAFKERVGFCPGTYSRIARLQGALSALRAAPPPSLSELAYQSGYADHAHMTREFRELTGRPPSAFRPPA
ncbi:transcriptional regulator, AraC family [Stigmatella aurantiaca]|uniref:Transcriptional regulator, AraC family n=1 Tax=Stigmatella aurantiaca TaxID=41 RepID=A0A1H7SLP3_STIAU|nr:helix-turn-helix domain-containing protein [Stigmatella aurantiaca]SEL73570.1 transcriptional regulator, AraC family [Stigmatella aurantiaca]